MDEMPKRIWAWHVISGEGQYRSRNVGDSGTEYVRSDVVAELTNAAAALLIRDDETSGAAEDRYYQALQSALDRAKEGND